jgi:hypothetical protein
MAVTQDENWFKNKKWLCAIVTLRQSSYIIRIAYVSKQAKATNGHPSYSHHPHETHVGI